MTSLIHTLPLTSLMHTLPLTSLIHKYKCGYLSHDEVNVTELLALQETAIVFMQRASGVAGKLEH